MIARTVCGVFTAIFLTLLQWVGAQDSPRRSEAVRPVLGAPLRDPSVCRGPDGTYYLTGTTALPGREGKPDFDNNRGVRVWASKDLQTWEDQGLVWDLWKDPSRNPHGTSGSAWQTELYPVPGLPPGERARGMTAPRLSFDGSRFWITFSMNGYAAGAMPGTGDIKGPYQDTLLLAEAGGAETGKSDASLFVDADGTRYLLWGGGCLARLKAPEALANLKANETGVEDLRHYLPAAIEGFPGDDGLPEHGAPYGVSLLRDGEQYRLVFAATTLRDCGVHEDTYVASAPTLLGPYSRPMLLMADGGRCTVFAGPDGALRVAYSTPDAQPTIAAYAPAAAKPSAASAPKPKRGEVVASVPRLPVSEKPNDVPQLLQMIEPLMDHPLRDAAICRGPNGTWYLTGTETTRAADGTLDWSHNNGVHLWSSRDRKEWQDLGTVWDIDRDAAASPKSAWQLGAHLDMTCGATPHIGRAMSAPEIHFLRGTFWIAYSMNGSGIGLLKSKTGKAEGPYEDLGRLVANGRDPSLFEDGDGTVHLVWGPGFRARMKDDMTSLADGPVQTLFTNVHWYPRYLRRPENMGLWGSHLVKAGDWYVWTFTTRTGRLGINSIDTMASWSKSLDGPWGEPCLVLANGGQSTLVADGEGGWLATVSGEDEYSQWPYRAAITPVVTAGATGKGLNLRPYGANASTADFQAVNSFQATALDLWIGHPDLIPVSLRDVFVTLDVDGFHYATGSFWAVDRHRRDVVLYRSKDKTHWEALPPVYYSSQLKQDIAGYDAAKYDDVARRDEAGERLAKVQVGENKVHRIGNDYYMIMMMFSDLGGNMLLKSTTGKITGPYRGLHPLPGPADLMVDDDGAVLYQFGDYIRPFATAEDLEKTPRDDFRKGAIEIVHEGNLCISEDCEVGLAKVNGKYLHWTTDWTGSYDANYHYADSLQGPWQGKLRILPYGGNGRLFQDRDGSWWYAYFMNSNEYAKREQNHVRMNMYPLWVGVKDGELILEPQAVRANRAALEKMGAMWHSPRKPASNPPGGKAR